MNAGRHRGGSPLWFKLLMAAVVVVLVVVAAEAVLDVMHGAIR